MQKSITLAIHLNDTLSWPPRTTEVTKDKSETAEMTDPKYDFSKIPLTNGLTATTGHRSHKRPMTTALMLIVAMAIAWYLMN